VVVKEKGKSYDVVARLMQAPQAVVSGTISVETNLPDEPRIIVPVTINVTRRP